MNSLIDLNQEINANLSEEISIDHVVQMLNELIGLDRLAMTALVTDRVLCNQAMLDHPTVQVGVQPDGYYVGMIGVINGLFGVDEGGFGPIAFVFRDGNLERVLRR